MQCPNCGHEQPEAPECTSCGVIIAKFLARQAELQQAELYGALPEETSSGGSGSRLVPLLVVVALAAAGAWWFLAPGDGGDAGPVASRAPSRAPEGVYEGNASPSGAVLEDDDGAIDYARSATVLIRTAWGVGSGFFVSETCDIVTNRHVVDLDARALDQADSQVSEAEAKLEAYRKALDARRAWFNRNCRDCSEEAYERNVGRYEKRYEKAREAITKGRDTLDTIAGDDDLTVVTSDGTEHVARILRKSEDLDLALLGIEEPECAWLEGADTSAVGPGDPVYTIGSPMGLRHSVTSGIFSGFQVIQGLRLMQTDAPINPGNSGGPLVNDEGDVLGINTMTVRNADGLSFAIPYDTARDALQLP